MERYAHPPRRIDPAFKPDVVAISDPDVPPELDPLPTEEAEPMMLATAIELLGIDSWSAERLVDGEPERLAANAKFQAVCHGHDVAGWRRVVFDRARHLILIELWVWPSSRKPVWPTSA